MGHPPPFSIGTENLDFVKNKGGLLDSVLHPPALDSGLKIGGMLSIIIGSPGFFVEPGQT